MARYSLFVMKVLLNTKQPTCAQRHKLRGSRYEKMRSVRHLGRQWVKSSLTGASLCCVMTSVILCSWWRRHCCTRSSMTASRWDVLHLSNY